METTNKKAILTIKDIAPYISHGLTGFIGDNRNDVWLVAGINFHSKKIITLGGTEWPLSDFYPILVPLDEMEDISENNEKRVYHQLENLDLIGFSYLYKQDFNIGDVPARIYNILCRIKVDFNDLIEKGLAVSINDVNI